MQLLSLLQCQPCPSVTLAQQSKLRTGQSIQRGFWNKGCRHDSTRQLSEVRGRKIRMWNRFLKCAQEDMKERAHAHTRTHRFGGSRGGIKVECVWGGDYRDCSGLQGPSLRKRLLCSPLGPPLPPFSIVFPLHSSLHAFTHAPQSQLSSGSRQPLREYVGT